MIAASRARRHVTCVVDGQSLRETAGHERTIIAELVTVHAPSPTGASHPESLS